MVEKSRQSWGHPCGDLKGQYGASGSDREHRNGLRHSKILNIIDLILKSPQGHPKKLFIHSNKHADNLSKRYKTLWLRNTKINLK